MRPYFIIAMGLIMLNLFSVPVDSQLQELPDFEIYDIHEIEQPSKFDIFVEAEMVTGCPAEILRGIAGVESHFRETAIGDQGSSHGMFQLHSRWHGSRVEKYGEFDPFAPAEAAVIAGYIMQENLRLFAGDLHLAIAAYKQGAAGVMKNGAIEWYVKSVLSWRENEEMMLSFFIFQGITDIEEMEYGSVDFGAQTAYKSDDTASAQVSRRGSGSIPY